MLSQREKELFLRYGEGLTVPSRFLLLHKAFEHQVDSQPDALALEYCGVSLTYAELEAKVNALANRLLSYGLKPRQRVCLLVQRSVHMVVAVLAVLKCGCQYVPLDGGVVPQESVSHIIEDTAAAMVLCLQKFLPKLLEATSGDIKYLILDEESAANGERNDTRPSINLNPGDGAYLIYTSGTTGKPKGVDVSHENLTNLLALEPGNLGIKNGITVPQLLSISFDMAQWEILGTLINGGKLLLRTSDWSQALKEAHTVIATPSILATIKKSDYPNIQVVALAGEPCPASLADEWSQACTLYNCCGPTEVTIVNTMHRHVLGQQVSIGRPVPNTSVYILDEDEKPVSIGEPGVMWAGGKCVSRGYLNLPGVTTQKFKHDIFRNDDSMMFNTGDLGRWVEDGTLENLGRVDDQVKIKGFRVELNSVTVAMKQVPEVKHACAIFQDNILWGFYTADSKISCEILQGIVAKSQPYYAIPSRWEFCTTFPLTSNGKIDKKALLASAIEPDNMEISIPEKALIKSEIVEMFSSANTETESVEEFIMPSKKGVHGWRALRHRFFSLYRRFFTIVLVANVVAILITVRFSKEGKQLENLGTAVAANLAAAVLMRQDHVVNLLFTVACAVPVSWPLWLRRNCAKVYHIGGLHSGCAIAATFWLLLFSIAGSVMQTSVVVQVVSYLILALLLAIIGTAHPDFRAKLHNRFELMHRFAGWTALALFWIQVVLLVDSLRGDSPLGIALTRSPAFWLLAIATSSVALPWLNLRKVTVRSDVLSPHAVRLYFDYCTPVVGTAVRLSNTPLAEWHAFATIAKPQEKGFSLLVSNAGDWTSHQIKTAPTKIWVRGVPACGVLRIAPLFKNIVLVATGSGIGPCLPVIYARKVPARIFWSTPNPEKTFGGEIIQAIKNADSDAVIHNTKTMGRPDMVAITYRLLRESGAEAVCVISNKKLTQMIVYAMESRGIPAFGAIFDS